MSKLGSADNRLKVAIVGAGPSGFYAADALINSELKVEVNLLEKLCAPYGLVRTGVAPDHPLIKKSIEKSIETWKPFFRFLHVFTGFS